MRTTFWRDTPSHAPYEAGAPQGPFIDGRRHGVESRGLQLRHVEGYSYPPEVCFPDWLVRVLEEQGDPSPPAHYAADRGATHHGAQGPLVRLRQVPVPCDVDADVRFGQAEVGTLGFAGLHLPQVAGLDVVAAGQQGMPRQEPQIPLEVGPAVRIVPYPVSKALEPFAAEVQGGQLLHGVEERFDVQRDLGDIPGGGAAASLDLPPLLRGTLEVPGVLRSPEGSAFNLPEALLALGLPQGHKAPL